MKLFQIVSDTGSDFKRSFRLAPNVRTAKESKPEGETYLKVTDVTGTYPIDLGFLAMTLASAGYGEVETQIIIDSVKVYDGAQAPSEGSADSTEN